MPPPVPTSPRRKGLTVACLAEDSGSSPHGQLSPHTVMRLGPGSRTGWHRWALAGERQGQALLPGGQVQTRKGLGFREGTAPPSLVPQDVRLSMARSCCYLRHLIPILNASKCHYTFV